MATTPLWSLEGKALNSTGDMVDTSLAGRISQLYNANYTEGRCYPSLTDGATVESAAVNWTLSPAFWPVIPINTVGVPYHVSAVAIETCDKDGVFELAIYRGVANTLMATARFSSVTGFILNPFLLIPSVFIPANSQIDAKLAYNLGGGGKATIKMSLIYRIL